VRQRSAIGETREQPNMNALLRCCAVLAAGLVLAACVAGCGSTEVYANLTVLAPTLDPGTVLTLVKEPAPIQFHKYKDAVVSDDHKARYTGITPGEYRLVVYQGDVALQWGDVLPLVPGENVVTFQRVGP